MIHSFNLANSPQLHFGAGKFSNLPAAIKTFGSKVLLITGARSFPRSSHFPQLMDQLQAMTVKVEHFTVEKEPAPATIDLAVKKFASYAPDVVVAIGGGSVLDAGKAISAMLPLNDGVKNYLEGVGKKPAHPGLKIPFIAVPTTSGTGSEATKNAVLSELGENGFKKSLRHNNFVPNIAILDPALTLSCPPPTTAASGMDAFTQLLESYLSTSANNITDALAVEGLKHVESSLIAAYKDGSNLQARSGMAIASFLSGVTLANAGLGLVHGFASSLGGFFEIPHGVICSSLMAAANKITVRKLRHDKSNDAALFKYATIGKLFAGHDNKSTDSYIDFLLSLIESWSVEMAIPRLGGYGISASHFDKVISATDNKNNPVDLRADEMREVLESAM